MRKIPKMVTTERLETLGGELAPFVVKAKSLSDVDMACVFVGTCCFFSEKNRNSKIMEA